MRYSLTILLLVIWTPLSFGQSSKEEDFISTIKRVVIALSKRDSVGLSKQIDKKTGVYLLYRIGVRDSYSYHTTLGFSDTKYPNAPRRVVIADNNGNELIFYLSYINNKWQLTIIDKLTCDCSV